MKQMTKFSSGRATTRTRRCVHGLNRCVLFVIAAGLPVFAGSAPLPVPLNPNDARVSSNLAARALNVRQRLAKETFDWKSFDINRGYSVNFRQPSSSAIALNRIHQNDPSRIFGALNANGQVYLVNTNGFLFGKGSRVNTKTLIATTHNISDRVLKNGISQVFAQTGEAALVEPVDENGKPLPMGEIVVEDGAHILAGENGQIILAAPKVTNAGTIDANNGQAILAGSQGKVYLTPANSESGVRGLLVEVDTGGEVTNLGDLIARNGNATMIGFAVNQKGRVSATTTLDFDGQIRLLAREGGRQITRNGEKLLVPSTTRRAAGIGDGLGTRSRVTFGPGSRTEILPDPASTATTVDGQPQPVSSVQVMGHQIEMQAGSSIEVPAGTVEMIATERPGHQDLDANILPSRKAAADVRDLVLPEPNDTRITIAPDARIDVSGSEGAVVPMERNIVEVRLTRNELRDSPLQKDGFLDGKTIRVDTRTGTPIADISAEASKVERSLAERTSHGGTVTLLSEGDAIVRPGSVVDVSGGSVTFEAGYADSSWLATDDGQILHISEADPNLRYVAILGRAEKEYKKWNQTRDFIVQGFEGLLGFEPGYVQGHSAGVFELVAPRVAFEGQVIAGSETSRRQRELNNIPFGGEFYLKLATHQTALQSVRLGAQVQSALRAPGDEFRRDPDNRLQPAPLELNEALFNESGLGRVAVISNGSITADAGFEIRMRPGSDISLDGGSIDFAGSVDIRSGSAELKTQPVPGQDFGGDIVVQPTAQFNLAGGWINDSQLFSESNFEPLAIDGGSLTIEAAGDLELLAGSLIDVRGGARLTEHLEFVPGVGGNLTLASGVVPDRNQRGELTGANLLFESTVLAHAFEQGGRFSLTSNEVIVVDPATVEAVTAEDGELVPTVISPQFLQQSGFGTYALESNFRGLSVAEGTELNLRHRNRRLRELNSVDPTDSLLALESGESLLPRVELIERADFERLPVNLELKVSHTAQDGPDKVALHVEKGAVINTDPGARVSLVSDSNLYFEGSINAPGGEVELKLIPPLDVDNDPDFLRNQLLWLGPTSSILAQGVVQVVADPETGRRNGNLYAGGSVRIDGARGYTVFESGALIDVSGSTGVLDIRGLDDEGNLPVLRETEVAVDAGSVDFVVAEGAFLDGTLVGEAASELGAAGGRLGIAIDPRQRGARDPLEINGEQFPTVASEIRVGAGDQRFTPIGFRPGDEIGPGFDGLVQVDEALLQSSGFESLSLFSTDRIAFAGNVDLSLVDSLILDAPRIGSRSRGSASVNLNASVVRIGSSILDRHQLELPGVDPVDPLAGPSQLTVNADLIELRGISALERFGDTTLNSRGDIRLRGDRIGTAPFNFTGEFSTAGNLTLQADQIYPTTFSDFEINLQGAPDSVLRVLPGSTPAPVLSAAGKLSLNAPNIEQAGVLKAPLGSLSLNAERNLVLAPGSLTLVSAEGQLIPFGRVQGGLNWVFPLGGNRFAVFDSDPATPFPGLPEKQITLNGDVVDFRDGAELNIDGGGDLFAFEVVRGGPGGSRDVLDPQDPDVLDGLVEYQEQFAILPGFEGAFAPHDHLETPASGLQAGDSIFLHGVNALQTGEYVLLPAHYALLPGAVLITPAENTQGLQPGQQLTRIDGAPITAGYRLRGATGRRESLSRGFAVEPGDIARTRSDYLEYRANSFVAAQAAKKEVEASRLPLDAGRVTINAGRRLQLGGQLSAQAHGNGRGGELDIVADRLAVVSSRGRSAAGVVEIDSASLNRLEVASLLLGGSRSQGVAGEILLTNPDLQFAGGAVDANQAISKVEAGSEQVTVARGANLEFAETLLIAKDRVVVDSGARISSAGKTGRVNSAVVTRGESAVVRVNNDAGSAFARTDLPARPANGTVRVNAGAVLDSGMNGSILLDAPVSTRMNGALSMNGGSLAFGAPEIDLGARVAAGESLVLNQSLLGALNVDLLSLYSRSAINFSASPAFGTRSMDLDLSATRLSGNGGGTSVSRITADTLTFRNREAGAAGTAGSGSGRLLMDANRVQLAAGDYFIDGFSELTIDAAQGVLGTGDSEIKVNADTRIHTPVWTALAGVNTAFEANGHSLEITGQQSGGTLAAAATDLGARLGLSADRLSLDTALVYRAGTIALNALGGDVDLQNNALLDVSGRFVKVAEAVDHEIGFSAPAGVVSLSSEQGSVRFNPGAVVDLSTNDSAGNAQGELLVRTPAGEFNGIPGLKTRPGTPLALLDLDVKNLGAGGIGGLAAGLRQSDIAVLSLTQRSGEIDLAAGERVAARAMFLNAEDGGINVDGIFDVSAPNNGGTLELSAADRVRFGSTARVLASGQEGHAGVVVVDAWDRNGDGNSGLLLEPGSRFEFAGSRGRGELYARVQRNAAGNGVEIDGSLDSTGAVHTTVEGVKVYNDTAVTAADTNAWRNDARAFIAGVPAVPAGADELVAGVIVDSATDLTLNTGLNFLPAEGSPDWRFDGRPGVLTLRAAGDLLVNASISDGFARGEVANFQGFPINVNNKLQPGQSWSYRLQAGGDVKLAANQSIRTGSGDISVAAGGDIIFGNQKSSIYSAGRQTTQTLDVDPNNPTRDRNGNLLTPEQIANNPYGSFTDVYNGFVFYAEYPVDGGDVSLNAGGDIVGAPTDQFVTDWLVRRGNWQPGAAEGEPTVWGIAIDRPQGIGSGLPVPGFEQSVGALGGGKISVIAGGNITDLSVVAPTTGKQIGAPAPGYDAQRGNFNFRTNVLAVQGGESFVVKAGQNIRGGLFHVGSGRGLIQAGVDIGAAQNGDTTLLALDQASVDIVARSDLNLGGLFNPTVMPQHPRLRASTFFTYAPGSAVSATAVGGDTVLNYQSGVFEDRFPGISTDLGAEVVPPVLNLNAGRDVLLDSQVTQFPSAVGNIAVIAGRDIASNQELSVFQSDANPDLIPNLRFPAANFNAATASFNPRGLAEDIHATTPLHISDGTVSVFAAGRDMVSGGFISLAEAAVISAGRDLASLDLQIQNTRKELSIVRAGRDILNPIQLNEATGAVLNQSFGLEFAGPGSFIVQAGRDLDLGGSNGITSIGNLKNPGLVDGGADLYVLAGMPELPDFSAFLQQLGLDSGLEITLDPLVGNLPVERKRFDELSPEQQLASGGLDIFYDLLREGGRLGAAGGDRSDYAIGDAAIAALFGTDDTAYDGNVSLFFSRVHTLDGGDINMLVPGGEVNAGLAVAFSGAKDPGELGIVAQKAGDVSIYVRDDLQVNTSRVATFGGGNILGWSKLANIDAGRGARSSITIPPPVTVIDPVTGLAVTEFPPAVAVSGIQAATTRDGEQGNVDLFAPNGVIDAGLAGIAGKDVTVGAVAVLNADNISVSGTSVGVPQAETSIAVNFTGASNVAASASKTADATGRGAGGESRQASATAGMLKVEFLGFES